MNIKTNKEIIVMGRKKKEVKAPLKNKMDILNHNLLFWDNTHSKVINIFLKKDNSIIYDNKMEYSRLGTKIIEHCFNMVFDALLKEKLEAYFYDNYFHLDNDTIVNTDASLWWELPIIDNFLSFAHAGGYLGLKYMVFHMLYEDDLLRDKVINVWNTVYKKIESNTLQLDLK